MARTTCARVVARERPPNTARAPASMYGVPRPWKAGMAQAPPASGTLAASAALSFALSRMPSPSRSHVMAAPASVRSEEHTSELQSLVHLVCRFLLECTASDRDAALACRLQS